MGALKQSTTTIHFCTNNQLKEHKLHKNPLAYICTRPHSYDFHVKTHNLRVSHFNHGHEFNRHHRSLDRARLAWCHHFLTNRTFLLNTVTLSKLQICTIHFGPQSKRPQFLKLHMRRVEGYIACFHGTTIDKYSYVACRHYQNAKRSQTAFRGKAKWQKRQQEAVTSLVSLHDGRLSHSIQSLGEGHVRQLRACSCSAACFMDMSVGTNNLTSLSTSQQHDEHFDCCFGS